MKVAFTIIPMYASDQIDELTKKEIDHLLSYLENATEKFGIHTRINVYQISANGGNIRIKI